MDEHEEQPVKGILRNAPPPGSYDKQVLADYDRKKVLENTMANAQLTTEQRQKILERKQRLEDKINKALNRGPGGANSGTSSGNVTNNIHVPRDANGNGEEDSHLQWDEAKLYLTDQEKAIYTMKISEPKTPYQGGVDPTNDYYRSDNESDVEGFSLGEPEFVVPAAKLVESKEEDESEESSQEEEHVLTPEEKHKKFEEMRKAHYHMKGAVLKGHVPLAEEYEEEQ